jgi:SanA protein
MRRLQGIKGKYAVASLLLVLLFLSVVFYCDNRISSAAEGKVFDDLSGLPECKTGLLLGTSRGLGNGQANPYYFSRIESAAQLMRSGKIRNLIISGDNGSSGYNEPEMMRRDLLEAGVDSSAIYLDYAGFRTLDSVVRCREIFSQDSVIVISQQFHNERAIYIANSIGMTAYGFNACGVTGIRSTRVQLREKLARVKVMLDQIFGIEPRFYGDKIEIR